MEDIKKWEQTFEESRLGEILEEANEYMQLCMQSTSLKKNEKELSSSDEEESSNDTKRNKEALNVVNYFVNRVLPILTRTILRKKISDSPLRTTCTEFLKDTLRLICAWIELDVPMLLRIMTEIFTEESKFYSTRTFSAEYSGHRYVPGTDRSDSPLTQEVESEGKFASPSKTFSKTNAFVELINFFGEECRGFEEIISRISHDGSDDVPKIKVEHVLFYLKVVDEIRRLLNDEFIDRYSIELKDAVFELILNFTPDELKATSKGSMVSVVEFLSSILIVSLPSTEVGQITEKFQLDVSLKCLESPSLEKRLQGLQVINGLIEMLNRKDKPRYVTRQYNAYYTGGVQSRVMLPTTKWLTPTLFLEWIDENKIIDQLFGEKMHHELLKRANDIFKFLAAKKSLTKEHIDALWNSCLGKQEQVMAASFLIISDLVEEPSFDSTSIDYLMQKITEFPVTSYDTNFISLLGDIQGCCLTKGIKTYDGYPLEFLWKAVQDNSGASEEVFTEALQVLSNILESVRGSSVFLKLCIANLRGHVSSPQSLQVLKKCISANPTRVIHFGRGGETVETVIASIENKYNLIDLFFEDFTSYHKSASLKSQKISPEKRDSMKYDGGYYPHLQRLQIHLDFLEYIMKHCALPLTKEHLSALWESIIEKPLSNDEQILGYQWFSSFCDKTALEEEILEYLFEEKLCALDFTHITRPGYECFEQLLFSINRSQGKLCSSTTRSFQVADLDLTGMASLWQVILLTEDEIVSDSAVTFLSSMYERLAPNLKSQQDSLREDLIRRIMKELSNASSLQLSAGLQQARFRIKRCLMLLQRFIELFDTSSKKNTSYATHGETAVTVCCLSEARDVKFFISAYRSNTLSQLCEKIATTISRGKNEVKAENIQLHYCGAPLNQEIYEYKTLRQLNINSNSHFLYSIKQSKATESEDSSPRHFLANDTECFEKLFELLDFDVEVGEKVWLLISGLPVNPARLEKMQNINETTNWEEVLPTHSTLQLLYSLQIIESIITAKPNTPEDQQAQEQWLSHFNMGFKRLLDIFGSYEEKIIGQSRKKCLATLLNIISIIMLAPKQIEGGNVRLVLKEDLTDVPFSSLMNQLLKVIWDSAKDSIENENEFNSEIVRYAGSLLVAILFSNTSLLSCLFDFNNLKEFVHCVTLEAEESIRDEMTKGICQLCLVLPTNIKDVSTDPRVRFIPMLLDFLPHIPSDSRICAEYFESTNTLVSSILQTTDTAVLSSMRFDETAFVNVLVKEIMEHPTVEPNDSADADKVIIGLMTLLSSLLKIHPQNKANIEKEFTEFVFKHCLFEIPNTQQLGVSPPPVCKSKESRKAAFALLRILSEDCMENCDILLHIIEELHLVPSLNFSSEWNYSPAAEQRSEVGYVGIKNLGCVCYMISLLQQLFMIPKFRAGILALPLPEDSKEDPLEDNLLYQLQVMFSNLQESYRQYFDPSNFCRANKDYDGQPTDVSIQMDADEFFNMLCDKVEEGLKKFKQEQLIKDVWCGKVCSQLICQECKTNSERDEAFFTISLDLKNKQSIIEALEFYVQGELLTGGNKYSCEKCDKKVDALMRRCVKTLPSTLILHMKRFEFNFDTMRKLKLNDYCEFPMKLNMKPYTREGIQEIEEQQERERKALVCTDSTAERSSDGEEPEMVAPVETEENEAENRLEVQEDEYYNYELVGILIHRGVADSGHYYSFIKPRNTNSTEPQWLEFNDELVRPFDVEAIEKECFGGTEQISTGHITREVNRTRNAYMLIYERSSEVKTPNTENTETPSNDSAEMPTEEVDDASLVTVQKVEEEFPVKMQKILYEKVWEDNMKFLMDKKLFDPDYASFCYELVQLNIVKENNEYKFPDEDEEFDRIRILVLFYLRILIHSKELALIEKYGKCLLTNIFSRSVPACRWFLHLCSEKSIRLWLLECTQKEPREAIVNIIFTAIDQLIRLESVHEEEEEEEEESGALRECEVIIQTMLDLLTVVPYHWRNLNEFFMFFEKFAQMGVNERRYLERENFSSNVLCLIFHGNVDPRKSVPKMGDKFELPNFSSALRTLSLIVRSSEYLVEQEEEDEEEEDDEEDEEIISGQVNPSPNPYALPGEKITLSFKLTQLIEKSQLKSLMEDKRNATPVAELICFFAWNSLSQTDEFVALIRSGINDAEYEQMATWFKLVGPFLELKDRLQNLRVRSVLSNCLAIMDKFKKYPKFTRSLITEVFNQYEANPLCKQWLDDHRPNWVWAEKWMNTRGYRIAGLNAGTGMATPSYFNQTTPTGMLKH